MFCTVCAVFNSERTRACGGCGASLRVAAGGGRVDRSGRAMTIASLLPVVAVLAVLLTVVGRSWQEDRRRADDYRAAGALLAEGRLLAARGGFAALDDYRDAVDQATGLNAVIAPLEVRTLLAGELLASGRTAEAVVELREIVAELPDLQEAVLLLEEARRYLSVETIRDADGQLSTGDVIGARNTLVAGLALEPTSVEMRGRLAELDLQHPLLLLTNAGDVALTEFDGDKQQVVVTGKDASWAVWSPDRGRMAFMHAAEASEDWAAELWVVDADGGRQRRLVEGAFRFGAPSWSPDGRMIVYVTLDEFNQTTNTGWVGLRAVDPETGVQRDLTGRRFDFTTSVVWSPDGRQLAFVERHIYQVPDTRSTDVAGGDLFVMDLHTGKTRNLTNGRVRDLFWVSWSPRGDQMLLTTDVDEWATSEPVRLVRLDVATGAIAEVDTRAIATGYPYWSPDGSAFAVVQDDRVVRIWSDDGESWVRLPTNIDDKLTWAPDSSAIVVPPKNVQDVTHVVHVGEELGRIDTIRVMFDNSYGRGGLPQWSPRTQPLVEEPLPSGTALD